MVYAEFAQRSIHVDGFTYSAETCAFLVYVLGIEDRLQFSRYQPFGAIDSQPTNMIDYVFRADALALGLTDHRRRIPMFPLQAITQKTG